MKNKIKKLLTHKLDGATFVAKIIPLMLTITFGAMLTFMIIDSASILQKKEKSDIALQKAISYCIQTNASETETKTLLNDTARNIWGVNMTPVYYTIGNILYVGVVGASNIDVSVLKTEADVKKFKADYSYIETIPLRK